MIKHLNEIEIEKVELCLRLILRLNKQKGYGIDLYMYLKNILIDLVYYGSRLVVSGYYITAFNYYMFCKSLKNMKVYFSRNRFTDKDYWLLFQYIITFISDYTVNDFSYLLSKD